MRVGIVGSEAAKFTTRTEFAARAIIRHLIRGADLVVSGKCHLGGIDVWAIEEAIKLKIATQEFPAMKRSWEGGYKERNLQIAEGSDVVYCLTLQRLPPTYHGMTFPRCYHCGTADHVKSGGCWTVKQAKRMGKKTDVIVIE